MMRRLATIAALLFATSATAADFPTTITDQRELDGISWQRARHNTVHPNEQLGTDADYISYSVRKMVQSWARAKIQSADPTAQPCFEGETLCSNTPLAAPAGKLK